MDRAYAQSKFIKEAEEMGIPSVRWSRDMEPVRFDPPACCPWPDLPPSREFEPPPAVPPPVLAPSVTHAAITWCPVQRRLLPRDESYSDMAESANIECRDTSSGKFSTLTLWGGGLSMLSGVGLFLWTALRKHLGKGERGNVTAVTHKSRVHARAWNII